MFVARVPNVRAVQPIGISEHRGGLVERDIMLGQVGGGLALVPFEHSFKYIHKRSALRRAVPCHRADEGSKIGASGPQVAELQRTRIQRLGCGAMPGAMSTARCSGLVLRELVHSLMG